MSIVYSNKDEPLRLLSGFRDDDFRESLASVINTAGGMTAKKLSETYFIPEDHKKARSFISEMICLYHFK